MAVARFPDGLELRAAAELRAAPGRRLEGYAATWRTSATIAGRFVETIRAGAFSASLAAPGADVLALVDHDPGRLLARTASGTLRLAEDARGLRFDLDVPDTQVGRDVLTLAERRDLGGMSFGFRVTDEAWNPARDRRELVAVELVEVSVIHAHAAYPRTVVQARGRALEADAIRERRRLLERL